MYTLPTTLDHLFELPISDIKYHGSLLAKSASKLFIENNFNHISKDQFFSLFCSSGHSNPFAEFFFFEFDKYIRHIDKKETLLTEVNLLIAKESKAKIRIERLSTKIEILESKIRLCEINAHKRLMNPDYCRRKMIRLVMSEMLYSSQLNKSIGADSVYYAPSVLVKFRRLQKEYNAELLANKVIEINGEKKSLAAFVNCQSRKISELHAKTKGFEDLANENGMDWAFITITAPAKFHPNPSSSKRKSIEWDKYKTRAIEAHKNLTSRWAAFGKSFSKRGYSMKSGDFFGIRVTEPHKDGCPHWHLLVFYSPHLYLDLFDKKSGLFFKKFGHSPKAIDIKFGVKEGVGGNGIASASSYAYKYITKALAGDLDEVSTIDIDQNSTKTTNSIERIESWRAATSIRAYQPFGISGLSTIWNSIRKVSSLTGLLRSCNNSNNKKVYFIEEAPFDSLSAIEDLKKLPSQRENVELSLNQYDSLSSEELEYLDHKIDRSVYNFESETQKNSPKPLTYKDYKYIDAVDEYELSEGISHLNEELNQTLNLNDFSRGFYEPLTAYSEFKTLLLHAVNGDWAEFYRKYEKITKDIESVDDYPVKLVKESYVDKYGDIKKKVIGINTGLWVYLFKKYTITTIPK